MHHVGSMRYHCELEVYILYIIYLCKKTAVNSNMLEVAFATERIRSGGFMSF